MGNGRFLGAMRCDLFYIYVEALHLEQRLQPQISTGAGKAGRDCTQESQWDSFSELLSYITTGTSVAKSTNFLKEARKTIFHII